MLPLLLLLICGACSARQQSTQHKPQKLHYYEPIPAEELLEKVLNTQQPLLQWRHIAPASRRLLAPKASHAAPVTCCCCCCCCLFHLGSGLHALPVRSSANSSSGAVAARSERRPLMRVLLLLLLLLFAGHLALANHLRALWL
jgi:hypothetical protein